MPEPGEATDPEWRLYARSAGDDKAPLAALFGALDALREAGVAATSNLKFLFEGEEEAGSAHLGEYLGFLHWRRDPRFPQVLRDAQARFGKDTFPDP